jgi:MFS family permease
MVAWGTVMTLMGIVQNYHGLLLCRLFLGVAEAGLYPGVAYYLTMWYCTRKIQLVSLQSHPDFGSSADFHFSGKDSSSAQLP